MGCSLRYACPMSLPNYSWKRSSATMEYWQNFSPTEELIFFLSWCTKSIHSDGIHKVSTTVYHPQNDGLIECFHRTLTSMLSTTTQPGGLDWDDRFPSVLFAHCCSEQESIRDSPFFMVWFSFLHGVGVTLSPGSPIFSLACIEKDRGAWGQG